MGEPHVWPVLGLCLTWETPGPEDGEMGSVPGS